MEMDSMGGTTICIIFLTLLISPNGMALFPGGKRAKEPIHLHRREGDGSSKLQADQASNRRNTPEGLMLKTTISVVHHIMM